MYWCTHSCLSNEPHPLCNIGVLLLLPNIPGALVLECHVALYHFQRLGVTVILFYQS